jgi:Transposase DDE domain
MDADLDLLLTAVYVTADDLLPERPGNAKRMVTDAEVVTLCVAQAIMGIPSDRRFLAVARKHLRHLFPSIPAQPGYFKRRRRLSDTLEWLMSVFASQSRGFYDDLLLVDSTPVECARSRETVKRSALGDAADYGWCASHSRFFWGFRLHALFSPDGTPRALALTSPKRDEREVALKLLERCRRRGGETVIGDKGYAGREFPPASASWTPRSSDPAAKTSPAAGRTSRRSAKGSRASSGLQGHPHARAPRRKNPHRAQRAHPATLPHPRRRHLPEPPTRPPQQSTRQLLRMNPVESTI